MLRYILAFATLYLNWCLRKQAVMIRKSYSIELNSHVSQPINLQQWSCCSQNDIYYPSIIGLASFLLCGQHIRLRNNLCCHILSFNPLRPANGHWLWKNAAHCIQMANSLICCSQILTGDSLVPTKYLHTLYCLHWWVFVPRSAEEQRQKKLGPCIMTLSSWWEISVRPVPLLGNFRV